MRSNIFYSIVFSLVILFSAGNTFAKSDASSVGKTVAEVLLFLPGMLLEEYFANVFDEEGGVDRSEEMVFIPYLDAKGLHPDYQRYITQTFTQYVKEVGRYRLKAADKESPYVRTASVPVITNIARKKGCPYVLFITVKENGSGMQFAFAMKDSETEDLIWHDEYMAIIPEDIAPILFRVANSMGTGKKGSNPKSFYDAEYPVYVKESNFQPTAATHASSNYEYTNLPSNFENKPDLDSVGRTTRVAFAFGLDLLFKDIKVVENLTLTAWHDFTYVMVGTYFDLRGYASRDTTVLSMGLNLVAPIFFHGNNTPYVYGGIGFSSTNYTAVNPKTDKKEDTQSALGGILSLGAGYQFNRYGRWTVRIGLEYFRNTYHIEGHKIQGIGFKTTIGY
ncbi:hypothetical protein SAMN05720468_11571 [Fibrobacter sp. UWEL]|nr:hypothetical protein SAMN05720468_11571 [Fibrobacter sp. UWEL]